MWLTEIGEHSLFSVRWELNEGTAAAEAARVCSKQCNIVILELEIIVDNFCAYFVSRYSFSVRVVYKQTPCNTTKTPALLSIVLLMLLLRYVCHVAEDVRILLII